MNEACIDLNFKSLADFLAHFKDEETCQKHFAGIRFKDGEYCPHCGHGKIHLFANGRRYRCASCKQDFTIKTGTIFGESKLPLQKWFIAIYLLSTSKKGISSVQLAQYVGVTQKTGWFMDHRIREAMKQGKQDKLSGTIEADETFVGGKAKNQHASKRKHIGTGGMGKAIVFGLKMRKGEVRAKVIESVKREVLHKGIGDEVAKDSMVYTDEYVSYRKLKGYKHRIVNHSGGEYVRGRVHTNTIENFWSLFKRGYYGIYHVMSRKHLQRYVDEFAYRYNRRKEGIQTIFANTVEKVALSKQMGYKALTRTTVPT